MRGSNSWRKYLMKIAGKVSIRFCEANQQECNLMNVFQVTQTRPTSLQDVSSPSRLEILNIIIITVQSNKSSRPVFFLLWFVSRSSPDSSGQYKPCQHVWGPCANDHTHHHARRSHLVRRFQARSLSGGRQSRKRDSPLGMINRFNEERKKGLQ